MISRYGGGGEGGGMNAQDLADAQQGSDLLSCSIGVVWRLVRPFPAALPFCSTERVS